MQKKRRNLFTGFVEDHLRHHGVEIREQQAIECRGCKRELAEDIVHANITAGQNDVVCPYCRTETLISDGVARIKERDPKSDQRIFALRKFVEKLTARDAKEAKQAVASAEAKAKTDEPIRLLHLSDLHFTAETTPETKLQWLLEDVHKGKCLGFDTVEYLVISGDMTDKGCEEDFEKAREFVSLRIKELGLSAQRCILVPGNHDAVDRNDAHESCYSADGNKVVVRSPENYPKRFQKFSDAFYHKLMQKPYPLEFAAQGLAYLFCDTRVQFLTLNSAWQIDQYGRKKSGMHPEAVAHVIKDANEQQEKAVDRGDLNPKDQLLRIGIWHHAAAGPDMIQDVSFIGNLSKAGVKVYLHGDVHDKRCELVGYKTGRETQILGAGSFGSATEGRPEAIPRLYNLLEIQPDLTSIRVHTREQRTPDGAWQGWHEWPDPDNGPGNLPYYDIDLS